MRLLALVAGVALSSVHPLNAAIAAATDDDVLAPDLERTELAPSPDQRIDFPRRGDRRRCLTTSRENCLFSNGIHPPTIPVIARDLSLEYRKSALLAEISVLLSAAGEAELARALTRLIVSYPPTRISALTAIAAQHTKEQDIAAAEDVLAEARQVIPAESTTPSNNLLITRALTQIGIQYAAIGQPETAMQLFDAALPDELSGQETFNFYHVEQRGEVAVGLLATGDTSGAETLTRQMLQDLQGEDLTRQPLSHGAQGEHVLVRIPPSVLQPFLLAGEHDFVIPIVQAVQDSANRTRWLSDICRSLVDFGEYDRALELAQIIQTTNSENFDQTKQIQPSLPAQSSPPPPPLTIPPMTVSPSGGSCLGPLQNQKDLSELANHVISLVETGDLSTAINLARLIPDPYYRMLALTEIAIAFAETDEIAEAQNLLSQALDDANIVDQMSTVATGFGQGLGKAQITVRLAEAGQFSKALYLAETIEEDTYKLLAQIYIAEQYIQAGEPESARELLISMLESVASLRCSICG